MYEDARRSGGFTLIELIGSMALLAILLGCFYATLHGLHGMQTLYESETMAVVVMNNVVERLDAGTSDDAAEVSRIFLDEYDKSPLSRNRALTPECAEGNGVTSLRILKQNGKPLAELSLKH